VDMVRVEAWKEVHELIFAFCGMERCYLDEYAPGLQWVDCLSVHNGYPYRRTGETERMR